MQFSVSSFRERSHIVFEREAMDGWIEGENAVSPLFIVTIVAEVFLCANI